MQRELSPTNYGAGTEYRNAGTEKSDQTIVPFAENVEAQKTQPMISRKFGATAVHRVAELAPQHVQASPEVELDNETAHLNELFHFRTPEELLAMMTDNTDGDPYERIRVTEQSEQSAVEAFIGTGGDVKKIVDQAAKELPLIGRDKLIPKFLRENHEVRIKLGQYLLHTLGEMGGLPDKIHYNWDKNPNARGYTRMPSKEYVAVLALAMLDGTFKANPSMPIMKRANGTFDDGTYRDTAQKLLRYNAPLS